MCYVCSHPLQYSELPQVIQTKTGWSRLHSSVTFNLSGTGASKGASKHVVAECIGVTVSPSRYSCCVFRAQLVLLCHDEVLLLHPGHESCLWDLVTLCSHWYSLFVGFTESSCVSPTTQKTLSCLSNFSLAVHQITFGGRPTQTSLIT